MSRQRLALAGLIVFYGVCAVAVTGPGLAWVAADGQRVAGIPVALAWNIGWVLASFVALGVYDRFGRAPSTHSRTTGSSDDR